ncbi:MAG: acyltransferase family protein, partial [Promethearchaeota archaeon]
IGLYLVYMVKEKFFKSSSNPGLSEQLSGKSVAKVLLLFGILISVGYFIMLLLVADIYWVTVNHVIQFQPTDLIVLVGLFGLGAYVSSKNWFTNGEAPGGIVIWGVMCVILTIAFFIVGENIFINPNSQKLSPGILITFAFIRSFLCLSIIFLLISITIKFLNKPNRVIKDLSKQSYNIYLVHTVVVVNIQEILINWSEGPVLVKILIVVITTLFLSYLMSKYIGEKFPRATLITLFTLCFVLFPILSIMGIYG